MDTSPDMTLVDSVTIDTVRDAAARLEGVAHRTPVHTSRQLDELAGASVFLKCESFQRIGAFKFRGAYNALSRLTDEQKARGVLAYSSGNHAQAVALASQLLGIQATIVMPQDAPRVKLEATKAYLGYAPRATGGSPASVPFPSHVNQSAQSGARLDSPDTGGQAASGTYGRVVQYDKTKFTREAFSEEIAQRDGLTIVPPYDHPDVIAGQGTSALELFEDVDELDTLYVCCGGGGLLSGCATAAKALRPNCRVIGVEPEAGNDATQSFHKRELVSVHNPETIADGARTPYLGRYTFPIILDRVDAMMTVTDEELIDAMRFVWERMKLVVEPTGVLGLAGLLQHARQEDLGAQRAGVIISGGNVDVATVGALWA